MSSRILVVTGIFPPDIGGPATYSQLLRNELPKRGFIVDVLSFGSVGRYPKIFKHLLFTYLLWRKSRSFDLLFAQDPISVGLAAALVSKLRRKVFFIRVAGDYAWEQGQQRFAVTDTIDDFQSRCYGWQVELFRRLQSWVVRQADQVITPSHYFKRLVSGWGVSADRIMAIYNGVNLAEIPKVNHPWAERSPIILSAGRLVPWKGFDSLINLLRDLPEWQLEIVGEGPDRTRLEQIINQAGVSERVHLLGGLARRTLGERLIQARVFILNTSFESFSFQVVEAMYAGVPVITTKIGSLPELITDGQEGFLVQPNDTVHLKSCLQKLTREAVDRERLIAQAQIKAEQFSIQATVDHLVTVLNARLPAA